MLSARPPAAPSFRRTSVFFALAALTVACKGTCGADSGQHQSSTESPTSEPTAETPAAAGTETAPAARPFFNESHKGTYSTLPLPIPPGDLRVSYTLAPGCTSVVATLGGEILRKANSSSDPMTGDVVSSNPATAGMHVLQVVAPETCSWTVVVAKK